MNSRLVCYSKIVFPKFSHDIRHKREREEEGEKKKRQTSISTKPGRKEQVPVIWSLDLVYTFYIWCLRREGGTEV